MRYFRIERKDKIKSLLTLQIKLENKYYSDDERIFLENKTFWENIMRW